MARESTSPSVSARHAESITITMDGSIYVTYVQSASTTRSRLCTCGGAYSRERGSLKVFHDRDQGEREGGSGGKNISPRDKVLTSSSGWSETPVKHIRENGSLKSEAAPNQEAAHDRGRDMGSREVWWQ